MHDQREARQLAMVRIMLDECCEDHHLTAKMFNGLRKGIKDDEIRGYLLKTAACLDPTALEMFEIMGKVAAMVKHPKLSELLVPERAKFPVNA